MKKCLIGFVFTAYCFLSVQACNFIKQENEYSCAPVSSYNLITNLCPQCQKSVKQLEIIQKTDSNGTTAYNLCRGLEKFFKRYNKKINIKYYGIKKVHKYKISSEIDLKKLKVELTENSQAIMNIGVYTKNSNGEYVRKWGHYVNLIRYVNDAFIVFDPYDVQNDFSRWEVKANDNIQLKNVNDNEKYDKVSTIYFINTPINYLETDEFAIINGIFIINVFN